MSKWSCARGLNHANGEGLVRPNGASSGSLYGTFDRDTFIVALQATGSTYDASVGMWTCPGCKRQSLHVHRLECGCGTIQCLSDDECDHMVSMMAAYN